MIRAYAKVVALVLEGIALAGATVVDWGVLATLYHAGLGILFAYVGFRPSLDTETSREIVAGLGLLVLTVEVVAILLSWLAPIHLMYGSIEITGLVVGVTSILAAKYLPGSKETVKLR